MTPDPSPVMPLSPAAQRAREYQERLERLRPEYEIARAKVTGPARLGELERAWEELREMVAGMVGAEPNTALYQMGQIVQLVRAVDRPQAVIARYESIREQIKALEAVKR